MKAILAKAGAVALLIEIVYHGKKDCERALGGAAPIHCPEANVTRAEMAVVIGSAYQLFP